MVNTAVLSKLGSIEGIIPLPASQTQSTVSDAASDITTQTPQQTIALQNAIAGVKDSVQTLALGVVNDGDKIRSLISQINLNRQLAVAQNEITELRSERAADTRSHGLEINLINNQNQLQLLANPQQLNDPGFIQRAVHAASSAAESGHISAVCRAGGAAGSGAGLRAYSC